MWVCIDDKLLLPLQILYAIVLRDGDELKYFYISISPYVHTFGEMLTDTRDISAILLAATVLIFWPLRRAGTPTERYTKACKTLKRNYLSSRRSH